MATGTVNGLGNDKGSGVHHPGRGVAKPCLCITQASVAAPTGSGRVPLRLLSSDGARTSATQRKRGRWQSRNDS
jgi:hypothetical protein